MEKNEERYMWIALSVIIVGTFMSILDTSIVNVAIPKMMTVFAASTDQIEWVVTGYMLTMSIIIPLTGYLGDRFGLKKMYVIALIIFTVGSALCGVAQSTQTMIAARVIQGVGGGMIMPIGMSMIFLIVPINKRGIALGVFGIAAMAAPAIGPTLSGFIVQNLDWRLIFYINVPVGIIGVTSALLLLEETEIVKDKKFDLIGALLIAVGLFTFLLALSEGNSRGWSSIYEIVLFSIALISLVSFVFIELTEENPLLDLRVLKNTSFSLSLVISAITTIGMFGALFLIPIYMQNIRGYSPMASGLLTLPMAIATAVMMPISGGLYDKYGAKWVTFIGVSILAGASYFLSTLTLDTSYTSIVLIMMVRGVGMGMSMMPIQVAGMASIPRVLTGRATALTNTVRQVSGSLGIAILTTVLQHREIFHTARISESINLTTPTVVAAQNTFIGLALKSGLSMHAATSGFFLQIYSQMASRAAIDGINDALLISTFICLAGVPLALLVKKSKVTNQDSKTNELIEDQNGGL